MCILCVYVWLFYICVCGMLVVCVLFVLFFVSLCGKVDDLLYCVCVWIVFLWCVVCVFCV